MSTFVVWVVSWLRGCSGTMLLKVLFFFFPSICPVCHLLCVLHALKTWRRKTGQWYLILIKQRKREDLSLQLSESKMETYFFSNSLQRSFCVWLSLGSLWSFRGGRDVVVCQLGTIFRAGVGSSHFSWAESAVWRSKGWPKEDDLLIKRELAHCR